MRGNYGNAGLVATRVMEELCGEQTEFGYHHENYWTLEDLIAVHEDRMTPAQFEENSGEGRHEEWVIRYWHLLEGIDLGELTARELVAARFKERGMH